MILIISTYNIKLPILKYEFTKPIEKIVKNNGSEYKVVHYEKMSRVNLENFSKIIICGTSLKDDFYLSDIKKFEFLKNFEKPIFAICSGAQIISILFSQKIKKHKTPNISNEYLKIIENDKILENITPQKAYHINKYYFDFDKSFKIILEGKTQSLVKHTKKDIYLSLFHPEVNNENLILNFLKIKNGISGT